MILMMGISICGCSLMEPTGTTTSNTGEETPANQEEEMNYPFEIIETKEKINATLEMKDGKVIKLELYPDVAPITVSNFVYLAEKGFYDGLIFHRIIEGFMIQGGDPEGIGIGGPGYSIKGEFAMNGVENNISHERGVISMARSQSPNSAGSQFFIMHAEASYLDGQYAAFGRVTEGIENVDAIATVKTDASDKPIEDVVIKTIKIER